MSGLKFFMVEQMGVEPTTYTMRTYRSSQLSYCPVVYTLLNIHLFSAFSRRFEKKIHFFALFLRFAVCKTENINA